LALAAEDPRAIVREATRAVEEEREPELAARWQGRDDGAARLGLATLARLRYDYPAAEILYRALDGAETEAVTAYARLGLAWGLEERGFSDGAEKEFERARRAASVAGDRAAEAEALIALSFVSARVNGMAAGLALLDRAQGLIPPDAPALES